MAKSPADGIFGKDNYLPPPAYAYPPAIGHYPPPDIGYTDAPPPGGDYADTPPPDGDYADAPPPDSY